jgi:N-acetylmuramoyl-L-alanine amidase
MLMQLSMSAARMRMKTVAALGVAFVVVGLAAAIIHPSPSAGTGGDSWDGSPTRVSASLARLFDFVDPNRSMAQRGGQQGSSVAGEALEPVVPVSAAGSSPGAGTMPPAGSLGRVYRVGIQAGHWLNAELPGELSALKGSTGAEGKGWAEVDVNLDIARRVVALLEKAGVQADLLPATVPVDYQADAFVALHGDANSDPAASGFKVARSDWSRIPAKDDALVGDIISAYQAGTGLKNDPATITYAMRRYYAFNNRRYQHAVDPATPSAILEMGFLTSPKDRDLLVNHPDQAARAIANGILKFLTDQG